jgi:hypothetical protein
MKAPNPYKRRAKLFKSMPMADVHQVLRFEKIVKNYLKMCKLLQI